MVLFKVKHQRQIANCEKAIDRSKRLVGGAKDRIIASEQLISKRWEKQPDTALRKSVARLPVAYSPISPALLLRAISARRSGLPPYPSA
jgi:hypothetical protein